MSVVALASVKGAPGVTTAVLALAAAWPSPDDLLVAELDPDGGVLPARLGLGFEPGLVTLAAGLRHGADELLPHTQALGAVARVVVAPAASEQVQASLVAAGERLSLALHGWTGVVLLDCGRLTSTSRAFATARSATLTLLLTRPRLDDVAVVRTRISALRRAGVTTRVVLVGDGPYHRDEVADAIGEEVLAVLPFDARAAAALNERAGRPSRRSALLRSAGRLAAALAGHPASAAFEPAVTTS